MPKDRRDYPAALAAAIARSPLAQFPASVRDELIGRGTRLDAPARSVVYREGDPALTGIVVHGTLRIFAASEDGRELTLVWAQPGDWLGHSQLAGGPTDVSAQAVTDATIHLFPRETLEHHARSDPAIAWIVAREVAGRLRQAIRLVHMLAFMGLRERVGQRLLELAFRQAAGQPLVARVSQQQLADAVGSPRTSVARVLAELRAEGVVRAVPGGTEILRPDRLTGPVSWETGPPPAGG